MNEETWFSWVGEGGKPEVGGFDEASLARLRGSWVIHSPPPTLRSSSVEGEGGSTRELWMRWGCETGSRGRDDGNGDEIWQEKKNYQYLNLP